MLKPQLDGSFLIMYVKTRKMFLLKLMETAPSLFLSLQRFSSEKLCVVFLVEMAQV